MTMFIKLENGVPVGHAVVEENLRMLFPEVNFPKIFFPLDVEPYGFGIFEITPAPPIPKFYKLINSAPEKREDGIYYQTWDLLEMTDQEKQEATADQSKKARLERSMRLMMSDWSQLPDVILSDELKTNWFIYRQSLRDITAQEGFPWEIVWPIIPE